MTLKRYVETSWTSEHLLMNKYCQSQAGAAGLRVGVVRRCGFPSMQDSDSPGDMVSVHVLQSCTGRLVLWRSLCQAWPPMGWAQCREQPWKDKCGAWNLVLVSWLTAAEQVLACTLKCDSKETCSINSRVSLAQQGGSNPGMGCVLNLDSCFSFLVVFKHFIGWLCPGWGRHLCVKVLVSSQWQPSCYHPTVLCDMGKEGNEQNQAECDRSYLQDGVTVACCDPLLSGCSVPITALCRLPCKFPLELAGDGSEVLQLALFCVACLV